MHVTFNTKPAGTDVEPFSLKVKTFLVTSVAPQSHTDARLFVISALLYFCPLECY